jgi:CheY-like chemotaxis protein
MNPPKILVVDDDPWTQRVVIAALREQGPQIATASDGTIALARAMTDPPDLVISDVMMPGMSGWTLVRKLRAHPQLALIPFIFLTALDSSEDKLRGFRLGADDYMPKPFRAEELALRVASVLRRSQNLRAGTQDGLKRIGPQRGFSGTLEDIGVASLLVLLEMERKTGLLIVGRPELGERARMLLREGRIVGAFIDAGPTLRHADAVYHVLRWSSGAFEFKAVPVEMTDAVGASTSHLLIEGARRLDEATAGPEHRPEPAADETL